RARDSGSSAVTEATELKGSDDRHFIIFHPVRNIEAEGVDLPRGFLAGVIRVSDLLTSAEAVVPSGTELALVEEDGDVLSSDLDGMEDYIATPIVIADRSLE